MKNVMEKNWKQFPRPDIDPLEQLAPSSYSTQTTAYFNHYGLNCAPEIEHFFGFFVSGPYRLAAHLYLPEQYKAAVLLLHGYLNHSGQMRHLLDFLLKNQFAVAIYDFPGHGLSSGRPAHIDHFEEYTLTLKDFLNLISPRLHGPYHAVGFSMGAAVLIDAILTHPVQSFDRIILAAPLLHWSAYTLSKPLWKIASRFTDQIPRLQRKNSSDPAFLTFNRTQDYLHAQTVSLSWVKALYRWNDKLSALPPSPVKLLILQGTSDRTVHWKYNLSVLSQKFPAAQIRLIPNARHELFHETGPLRQKAVQAVLEFLSSKDFVSFSKKTL
jgi:alpha-beta hydrolase superfamily lysophospholipase